jgi:cytochrome c peroxidase
VEIPEYAMRFAAVYPDIAAGRAIDFTDVSNAIAAFIASEWRSDGSRFDAFLRSETPLPEAAAPGFDLFRGGAGCATCHSGALLTDQRFHPMADPQLGPGKAARFESHQEDTGRFRVTGQAEDLYAFRTPSLRNVTRTGPWGHAGGFSDLAAYLSHHADPDAAPTPDAILPELVTAKPDWGLPEASRTAIRAARTAPRVALDAEEIALLLAFLETLEDPVALAGRLGVPDRVPSGLPVDR